jgi:predicted nucleic acid-binding protein
VIVVDAAAWVRALVDADGDAARSVLESDLDWAAPAHMPIEVLRTLRRYEYAGLLTAGQAGEFAGLVEDADVRYAEPEGWLLATVWRHRHNISPYDAAYVALAMNYDVPVVTFDARLAKAARAVGAAVVIPGAS